MRISLRPVRRKRVAYGLYGTAAALVVGSLVLIGMGAPADADTPGTDWGPNGVMAPTSSAVTVQWDNTGSTPTDDVVPRNATQVIPHTGGKTYADVDPSVSGTVSNDFGGLKLTVSQTTGLRHQGVDLTVTGESNGGGRVPNSLLVMQCWGSPSQTAPDPTQCQDGQGTVDGGTFQGRTFSALDQAFAAGSDLKAETGITLYGQIAGGGLTLTAAVHANVFVPAGEQDLASGARGQVQFLDGNTKIVATVPVSNGIATASIANPEGGISSYTAQYVAASDENFLSSPLSAGATDLPYTAPTAPGIGDNTNPVLTATIPFSAVDGTTVPASELGNYFSSTTTNEIRALILPDSASGTASRTFEVQTGVESSGLGCGYRSDQPSTDTCWLVAVPFDDNLPSGYQVGVMSPLSPSLWAQRMQVKLNFAPATSNCGGGARELTVGSELLLDAMNSWIPAVCLQDGVDLGYVQSTDDEARDQLTQGNTGLVFTSAPVDTSGGSTAKLLYAPASLTAITVSVLAVDGDSHTPVIGIKLDARLIAKLLTQSYQNAIDAGSTLSEAATSLPWQVNLQQSLATDPEFKALNPNLPAKTTLSSSDLIVTVAGTDGTQALWQWLVHDPEAKSYLDGCPDTESPVTVSGTTSPSVINPFFSTRSYAECRDQATQLEAVASSWRSAQSPSNPMGTKLADGYADTALSYPPTNAPFPQPGYYERSAKTDGAGKITQLPLTLADLHPRENSLSGVATDVFRGLEKSLGTWCPDATACPGTIVAPPGIWINSVQPSFGSGILGFTDGSSAAADLLPTALLCDDSGSVCTGANNASLQAAAGSFVPAAGEPDFLQPPLTPDWADGAYPLTIPVYAEVNTTSLTATDAGAFAKVLSYISGPGQQQGYDVGQLPPGVAPLTPSMVAQTAGVVTQLQALAVVKPTPKPTKTAKPTSKPSPSPTQSAVVPPIYPIVPPTVPPVAPVVVPPSQPAVVTTPSPLPTIVAQLGTTPASNIGPLPGLALAGLIAALLAGVAAPLIGRPRKVKGRS